jgi:pre-rRNA-processing protein IPI3
MATSPLRPTDSLYTYWAGPVTNVLIVIPKRKNLPPLQPLRKVRSGHGEVGVRAILPRPESDVPVAGNSSSIFLERCLETLQVG